MAKKRAWLKDFQPDVNGGYVYTGAVYTWTAPEVRRRALTRLWASGLLMAAAAIGSGCFTAGGMGNCAWVLLPYIAELIALAMLGWALWRLSAAGMEIRNYIYEEAALSLKGRSLFACITTFILLGALVLYSLLNGTGENTAETCAVIALQCAACLCSAVFCRAAATLRWEKKA